MSEVVAVRMTIKKGPGTGLIENLGLAHDAAELKALPRTVVVALDQPVLNLTLRRRRGRRPRLARSVLSHGEWSLRGWSLWKISKDAMSVWG